MSRTARFLRSLLLLPATAVLIVSCDFGEAFAATDAAVARFHELFNDDQFATIYGESTSAFKGSASEQNLVKLLEAVKRKIGKVQSTSRQNVNVFSSTNGTTISATYMTKYEGAKATESFRFMLDAKKALLVGYNVSSLDLIVN